MNYAETIISGKKLGQCGLCICESQSDGVSFLGLSGNSGERVEGGGEGQGGGWVGGGAVERLSGTSQHSLASGSLRTT